MSLRKEVVTGTLVAGGVIGLFAFIWKLHRIQLNLEAIPTASIHKITLSGITIRLDVLLKNPTKGSFSAKFPFVKINYKNAVIGSSQVVNKDIAIPAYGQVMIEKIMIDIPLSSAFTVVSSLLKSLQSKEPVKITATIMSTVFAGPMNLPFNKDFNLTLA
jgi:hypothetical protein